MKKYLITYTDYSNDKYYVIIEAENYIDLFISFAYFQGKNTYLFKKAISNLEYIEDFIAMYYQFTKCEILSIREVGDAIYEKPKEVDFKI